METDPLDLQKSTFQMSKGENALIDAFETAAASFRVAHNFPGATYYQIPPENEEPSKQTTKIEKQIAGSTQIINDESFNQNLAESPEEDEEEPIAPHIQKLKDESLKLMPPPLPQGMDPERARLLHSWFWAGYYTGYEEGKKAHNS